jgi:hypothetical protein
VSAGRSVFTDLKIGHYGWSNPRGRRKALLRFIAHMNLFVEPRDTAVPCLRLRRFSWALLAWREPEVFFNRDAGFEDEDAFGFEQFALQGGVGFANQEFAACADDAVPRNASAGRTSSHCVAGGSCAAAQLQGFSECPIRSNPAARNLFHQLVNGIEGRHSGNVC